MNSDRAHTANPLAARRAGTRRKRTGRRAAVAAFEAWQRRQAHAIDSPPRPRRS
jgi:hypothetical protein